MKVTEAIEELNELRALVATPGWARVLTYIERSTKALSNNNEFAPIGDLSELFVRERVIGEIKGLNGIPKLVDVQIRSLEAAIEAVRKEQPDAEEEEVD